MQLVDVARNAARNVDTLRDVSRVRNPRVLRGLVGPAVRGYLLRRGQNEDCTTVPIANEARFDWTYESDGGDLAKLYRAAKRGQWDAESAVDWSTDVDPYDPERDLAVEGLFPLGDIPAYRSLDARGRAEHRHALMAWMLSQFLHGEQGALFAACQVTQAVPWMDGKLYGGTQVVDEARHVEVFHRYLAEKLEKSYEINDNLYVLIEGIMGDVRWDVKFLGMQIMVEGLALAAFGTIRQSTREPLLRDVLKLVITDEARHVHYGVVALDQFYARELPERERREREDWAYEMAVLMRNRFLAHEFYEEYYAHAMSRTAWNRLLLSSDIMGRFRRSMFRRIVPNLKRVGLLSDRIRAHYAELGLLDFEHEKAAPDLSAEDLLAA